MTNGQEGRRPGGRWLQVAAIVGVALLVLALTTISGLDQVVDEWLGEHVPQLGGLRFLVDLLFVVAAVYVVLRWRGIRSELAARRRAERALRDSEQRFSMLASATTEAIAIHERGTIIDVNDVFCEMFRVRREDAIGRSALDFTAPESRDLIVERVRSPIDEPYEAVCARPDGTRFPVEITARSAPFQGRTVRVTAIRDLTERKQAGEALREAETLYRSLVEQIPAITYIDEIDESMPSGVRSLYMSPQVEQLLGYAPEEFRSEEDLWARIIHPADRDAALASDREFYTTGHRPGKEYRLLARDGAAVWVFDQAAMLPAAQGKPRLVQGILLDVTERKNAEEALSRREAVLEAVAFAAGRFLGGSWEGAIEEVLARLGTETGVSRAYLFEVRPAEEEDDLLAFQRFEWCAQGIAPQIGNPSLQGLSYARAGFRDWGQILLSGGAIHARVRDLPPGKREFLAAEGILAIAAVPVLIGKDLWGFLGVDDCVIERDWSPTEVEALRAAAGVLGAAIGRQRAERALGEAESRFRTLVEQLPAVTYMWRADPDTHATVDRYMSPQLEQMLGYTLDELAVRDDYWYQVVHPDDRDAVASVEAEWERNAAVGREPFSMEYRLVARDGRVVWVHDRALMLERAPDGYPTLIQGVLHDVSERKRAEEAGREAEARYRNLVEQVEAVTYIEAHEPGDNVLYISPQVEQMFGFPAEEWLGPTDIWARLVHPEDRGLVQAEDDRATDTGEPFVMDYRMLTRDGEVVWVHEVSKLVRDGAGEPLYWQAVMFDITERKRAEEALREAEERFRVLVEQIPAVTYVWNSQATPGTGDFSYISPQIEDLLGIPPAEWILRPELWDRQVHPADREDVFVHWRETDVSGEPFRAEYRLLAHDGDVVWVRDEAVVVERDEDGRPRLWQGVLLDVTERRRSEQQRQLLLTRLVQAQEEERRRISADIHDDPVQKMTAVGLRLEALKNRVADPELAQRVHQLEETVGTAIRGLRNLLFELRPPALDKEGIAPALRQFLDETARDEGFEIELDNRLAGEPPVEVRTLAYRIAQEAIRNARKHAAATRLSVVLEPRSGGLYVRVADDGKGLPSEDGSDHPGHVGMLTMRERAELAGGWWRVGSQPGRGTTVEFWLPAGEPTA